MSKEPLFVTCPVCGKVNQKSLFTYSEVRCQRCHRELTAFADLGVVVGIDMNKNPLIFTKLIESVFVDAPVDESILRNATFLHSFP